MTVSGIASKEQVWVMLCEMFRAEEQGYTVSEVRVEAFRRGFVGHCSAYRRRLDLLTRLGLARRIRGRGAPVYRPLLHDRPWAEPSIRELLRKGEHHHAQREETA